MSYILHMSSVTSSDLQEIQQWLALLIRSEDELVAQKKKAIRRLYPTVDAFNKDKKLWYSALRSGLSQADLEILNGPKNNPMRVTIMNRISQRYHRLKVQIYNEVDLGETTSGDEASNPVATTPGNSNTQEPTVSSSVPVDDAAVEEEEEEEDDANNEEADEAVVHEVMTRIRHLLFVTDYLNWFETSGDDALVYKRQGRNKLELRLRSSIRINSNVTKELGGKRCVSYFDNVTMPDLYGLFEKESPFICKVSMNQLIELFTNPQTPKRYVVLCDNSNVYVFHFGVLYDNKTISVHPNKRTV